MAGKAPNTWPLAVALVIVTVLFRFPGLDAQNLWCDEIYSLELSRLTVSEIFTFQDGHPPLFHLLMKPACSMTGRDVCGRVLSAALGVLTVPLLFAAGARLFDRRVGSLAAALLATSAIHIWYSREGRMYALVTLWSVLASYYLPDVVDRRWRGVIGYSLATLGGLMSHYAYVAVALVQLGFVLALAITSRARRRLTALGAAGAALGTAALFLSPALRELALGPVGPVRASELFAAPYAVFALLTGFGIGPPVRALQEEGRTLAVVAPYFVEIAAATVVILMAALAGVRHAARSRPWGIYLLAAVSIPLVIVAALSWHTGLAFNPRYVIGTLPAWYLLIALGIARSSRSFATVALLALFAMSSVSVFRDRTDPRYQREQLREAAAYVSTLASPEDRIYFGPVYVGDTIAHYLAPKREIHRLPVKRVLRPEQLEVLFDIIAPVDSPVWVFRTREWSDDPRGLLRRALRERVPENAVKEFAGVSVYRLDP